MDKEDHAMCKIVPDSLARRVTPAAERMRAVGRPPGSAEIDRRGFLKLAAAASVSLATAPAWAQTSKVEVHWLGQSATKITTLTGKVIVIDPFLTNNPKTPAPFKNLDALGKVD